MVYSLKNLTETNPGLFSKISNDKTLAYSNNGVYARLLNNIAFVLNTSKTKDYKAERVYAVFEDGETTLIVAIPKSSNLSADDIITDLKFVGYFSAKNAMRWNEVNFLSFAYVPFTSGPQNSVIPVMWRTLDKYDVTGIDISSIDKVISNLGVMNDSARGLASYIEERFPSVDLKEQKNERYIGLPMRMADGSVLSIMYNRNHIAYNGNISGEVKTLPIICAVAACRWSEINVETLSQYLNDDYHNNLIISKDTVSTSEPAVKQEPDTSKKSSKELETETNPLLRAAKIAGGNVK